MNNRFPPAMALSLKSASCLLAAALCLGAQAAPVTEIFTTFNPTGVTPLATAWRTTTGGLVDDSNELLAFTVGGITYTTGVGDNLVPAPHQAASFRALAPEQIPGRTLAIQIGIATKMTGSAGSQPMPAPYNGWEVEAFLHQTHNSYNGNDRGLELGTMLYNMPEGFLRFPVQIASGTNLNIPAIIATQMGDAADSDKYCFTDAADQCVGNEVDVNFTRVPAVARHASIIFANSTAAINTNRGGSSSNRNTRVIAYTLQEFGLTDGDLPRITGFRHKLSPSRPPGGAFGQSDVAFVAYNDKLLAINPIDLAVTAVADNTRPAAGEEVLFTITLTNNDTAVQATDALVEVELPLGYTLVPGSVTPQAGSTYDPANGQWAVPTLAAGGRATLTLRATASGAAGTLTATRTGLKQTDTKPDNDVARVDMAAPAPPAPPPAVPGQVAAVPALDSPGLWALMLLLAGAGVRHLRHLPHSRRRG